MKFNSRKNYWLISVICFLFLSISTYAQDLNKMKFTFNEKDVSIKHILEQVEKSKKIRFFYDEKSINVNLVKNIDVKNISFEELINTLFNGTVNYAQSDNGLVTLTTNSVQKVAASKVDVTGVVNDTDGFPLSGVFVYIKGQNKGTYTDGEGQFNLPAVEVGTDVTFDYIGMKPYSIKVASAKKLNIKLEDDAVLLEDVIITGYGTIKKSAYAGSATTIKSEDVKDVPTLYRKSMV